MIEVKQLDFTYSQSGKHAVKTIQFAIEKGEIFGFLGPNGAGKTTTQRLIIGLLKGYQGDIKIRGKERRNWNKDFYEHIGVAFDFPNLYLKLTGEENLQLISSYYQKKPDSLDDLLDQVDLLEAKNRKVEDYSKGMKMRLNFIRSIMHDPDIVFFDEPTSGLDPVNAKIIRNTIHSMKEQGKTIFLTTHNMTVAEQLCDRVAFINNGTLSAVDSPRNLMREHGNQHLDVYYWDGNQEQNATFPLQGLGGNSAFQSILNQHEIRSIHSQEATLEDVFIKYTGVTLS